MTRSAIRNPHSAIGSLPLHLVQLVRAFAGAELLHFDLLHAARDLDLGAVVQVAAARALQPDVFATLFSHDGLTAFGTDFMARRGDLLVAPTPPLLPRTTLT